MAHQQNISDIDAYFDKIFYINLDQDKERNAKMIQSFKNFSIKNFERIAAIRVKDKPHRHQYRNYIKTNDKYIIGSYSCMLSHLKCISIALERQYSKILIFEDDVAFLEHPSLLLSQNKHLLEDWDLIYFGGLIERALRSPVVCAHAYAVKSTVFENIIYMAESSGMEIDLFYANVIQQMTYSRNRSGKYNVKLIQPFNKVVQVKTFESNIQN